ncbi:hypothetical protein [Stenotrophomonas maltophilia]|uniref:hypothetical protein n=1 Tax=Stenotrophomonas maltophilia TaxID=40324 RepID=UPI001180514C|nr:hypothetical protein [Stenotrophomonas maltophilia]
MNAPTLIKAGDRYEVRSSPQAAPILRTNVAAAAKAAAEKNHGHYVFDNQLKLVVAEHAQDDDGKAGLWIHKDLREALRDTAERVVPLSDPLTRNAQEGAVPGFLRQAMEAAAARADLEPDEDEPDHGDLSTEQGSAPAANDDQSVNGQMPNNAAGHVTSGIDRITDELVARMRALDLVGLVSDRPTERELAEQQFSQLVDHSLRAERVIGGVAALAVSHLPAPLAERLRASIAQNEIKDRGNGVLEEVLDLGSGTPGETGKSTGRPVLKDESDRRAHFASGGGEVRRNAGGAGAGSVLDALVTAPFTFARASASGLRSGTKAASEAVTKALAKRRFSAFEVVGRQMNSLASEIDSDARWLKANGMGGIAQAILASGLPLKEALAELERGGRLEDLGLRAKGLLREADVQQRMQGLDEKITRFGKCAARFTKAAEAAGMDREAAESLQPAVEKVGQSVQGIPSLEKDGKLSLVSEKFGEIADKIHALIESLMSKFMRKP